MSTKHFWEVFKHLKVEISQIGLFLVSGSMVWEEQWICVLESKRSLSV